ncbi:hypothetical protein MKX07_003027 [Trichoderma sp. CBMAI-0711]|nr:hypothetical protein MKX07_003027 [Trichoderma sp. CBMAI-0711]
MASRRGDGETKRDGDGEAGGLLGVATDQDSPRDEERGNEAEGRLDAGEACAALESHRQVGWLRVLAGKINN